MRIYGLIECVYRMCPSALTAQHEILNEVMFLMMTPPRARRPYRDFLDMIRHGMFSMMLGYPVPLRWTALGLAEQVQVLISPFSLSFLQIIGVCCVLAAALEELALISK